ncbi:hypothetical protein BSK51_04570 [Paenibacillus odorifer]|uniref:Uncharacterized protein n=2 Tax=Paenibacillus TaxID=44249 RepID=A0ABX3HVD7_9BACL|nr:hypothetical protein BSK51_04570 [Paenibacillus odorifer]
MYVTMRHKCYIICYKIQHSNEYQTRINENQTYSMHVALAITCMTFVEIVMAVHGAIVMMRKGKAPAVSAIKLSNLAASLISLVLTQTAILSFTHQGDMSYYNGLAA